LKFILNYFFKYQLKRLNYFEISLKYFFKPQLEIRLKASRSTLYRMYVIKRDGSKQPMRYDSITDRNEQYGKDLNVDVAHLSQLVINSLKSGMTTSEIDVLSSETAFYQSCYEPDYDILATRIAISNLHKSTSASFVETVRKLKQQTNKHTGRNIVTLSDDFVNYVELHADKIENAIDYARDYKYTFFGLKTLQKLYLLKLDDKIIERPQHMIMRVSIAIHMDLNDPTSIDNVLETYEAMSNHLFTHASPTLFNAGNPTGNLSSCFLLDTSDDLDHIFETIKRCALISKLGGGIGVNISKIRAKGSVIHSSNGKSDGIVPMIQCFNSTARYSNQCFTPETKIVTRDGPKDICNITTDDFVLTKDGTFKRVLEVHVNPVVDETLLNISNTNSNGPVRVTKQHDILVLDKDDSCFKPASELTCEDFVALPTSFGKLVWIAIESITTETYTGDTYDLSVDQNENYVVSSFGIVHNSGRRAGSFAMYLEPSHPDVMEFLALRLPTPPEELRARDIFLAMWIPDLFMKRVQNNEMWSLFCPSKVPLLNETYGAEYEEIYLEAEAKKLYNKQMPAQEIWKAILQSQQETGLPYITYKDSVNEKSMQKNLGIVRSSNLCNEIVEVTYPDSVAVCNLASVVLHKFVSYDQDNNPTYDFIALGKTVKMIVRNLNKVIDKTHYPVDVARANNLDFRPIGLGVQGLADTFAMFKTAWGSELSMKLNRAIFETIYYHALEASAELAEKHGAYRGFYGSPVSQGILQYHLWKTTPITQVNTQDDSLSFDIRLPTLDWESLIVKCRRGVRNSLLVALMPTASSSQILGSNECFEPFTSNIYSRSTNSGEFIVVNRYLYRDLKELGLWSKDLVNEIIRENGSVQSCNVPQDIKDRYKTVWEISQKIIIDMAADRGAFVDQTQSMNIFIARPSYAVLSSMHMYGWNKFLKTGCYYIRSKPATNAIKFSLGAIGAGASDKKEESKSKPKFVCVGEEGCLSCSS
jgi:ribonucleoside-diphosphate reductase alpha subunit